MSKKTRAKKRAPKKRMPALKNMQLWLKGTRLVCMESCGLDVNGKAEMLVDATPSSQTLFKKSGVDMNKLITGTPHNWLVTVTAIIKDIHGNYDPVCELEVFKGTKIDDTEPKVTPMLETIKDGINEKMIVDYGWIAEILPTKRYDHKWDLEAYEKKAEEYLINWVINRHIGREVA